MTITETAIDPLNWADIALQLATEGYALLPGLLGADLAQHLAGMVDATTAARRVSLASNHLGRGELWYFNEGLPAPCGAWGSAFYRHLTVT